MKVHRTTRSNVLILIGGFLLACFLVALMPFLRNRSPILTPESIETAAKRLAPENAYFLVSDAVNALPNRPPPLVVPSQDNPKMTEKYVPASGSAAWLVNVERPDDDPEFIAYMKECEPSIEKVREALNSPYFLWPVDWKKPGDYARLLHGHDSQFWRIVESPGFMMARALQLLREGEEEAAVLHILDAFRFPVMLYSDGVQETRHAMWYATRGVFASTKRSAR